MHYSFRKAVYLYVKDNITKFYEYCYVEEGIYYIDIEEKGIFHQYILDEYVEKIKEDSFFSGFIEINAASTIINRPIIRENLNFQKSYLFYSILALFNLKENEIFNVEDIIFINYVNRIYFNIFWQKKKQIIDLRNENKSILDNIENEISKPEIEIKSQEEKKNK